MSEETNHSTGDKPAVPSNPLLGEKCGHQCRTLAGLHTCTLKKGHRFCHQEYGQLSCPVASWSDNQGRYPDSPNAAHERPAVAGTLDGVVGNSGGDE
jgi:hypothetical protein